MRPNIATQVDDTFIFICAISVILLLIITGAMLYFVYKYNKKRNPIPEDIEGNTKLEVIWTIVPIILVMAMFFVSWAGFRNMRDVPKDAMVVTVIGQMWKWSFEYDNKKKSDTLILPVNKDIKFDIVSQDVVHSFYLPTFRVKEDAVPGKVNYFWIRTIEKGNYFAACAEYCGLNHSYMYAPIVVVDEEKFLIWKNYFPPDTTKSIVVTDSVKTTIADTSKSNIKLDTLKKDSSAPDLKKTDTLKK